MRIWTRLRRVVRFNYLRVLRLKTSAHSIALGCAIGLFVGFMPLIPFQTPTVLFLALMFRANKLAAFLCTFISNPVNIVPFYFMLYKVGLYVMPFHAELAVQDFSLLNLIKVGWQLVAIMFAGGFILGIPSSIVLYFVALRAILVYRKQRALRLLRRKHQQ